MDVITQIHEAVELVKKKKYKIAEKIYLDLYEKKAGDPVVLSLMGYLYLFMKKYKKAEMFLEKAYTLSRSKSSLEGLAAVKFVLNKHNEAIKLYVDLVKIEPKYEYYKKLTLSLIYSEDAQNTLWAYNYCNEAVQIFPSDDLLLLNLSIVSLNCGKFDEAEKYCCESLKINNKNAKAISHLGYIYECLYLDVNKAKECYKKSIKCGVGDWGYYNLGYVESKLKNYSLATRYYKKLLKKKSGNETVLRALAHNYLIQRKFNLGYKYYIQQNDKSAARNLKRLWDGRKHKKSTIYVFPDLAYGDHIMFMRYIPFLKKYFKKIKVYVYPQLKRLFEENFKDVEFVTSVNIKYDYSVALSKLPYYLKMDFHNIPFNSGYLSVKGSKTKSKKLKIGICWEAGNADIRSTIHRTINIDEFSRLFNIDADFYSFQVNPSTTVYKNYNMVDLGKDFKDFYDTAIALKDMDLVVSVDTSVANLAGAMGIKTFMLLPYYSDWRWFDNTEKTEWYDSIKIFKQSIRNSWKSEFERIAIEIDKIKIQMEK